MMDATLFLPLRPMLGADLDPIMRIEEQAYPYPWTRGIFSDCLRHHYPCFVYEEQHRIVAYCVLMLSLDELHLLNLTVTPQRQQQGLGRKLLNTVERVGLGLAAKDCFLEVRPSNVAARQLYLRHGFHEIGLRKNYYPAQQGREDAILMAKTLFPFD